MGFHAIQPGAPLDTFIERIWDWDMPQAAHHLERVLPSPAPSLIINLHEDETRTYTDDALRTCTRAAAAVLGGPTLRSQVIDTSEQVRVMGVVFRPAGAWVLTREDQTHLVHQDVALEDLFGSSARRLREQLLHTIRGVDRIAILESWLVHRVTPRSPDACVLHALDRLRKSPNVCSIAHIVKDTGLSAYTFNRRFRAQVGMGPKQYSRLMRFLAVVDDAFDQRRIDWASVAADNGYADQSHLTHEFRAFAGMTPGTYEAARGEYRNHIPLDV